MTAFTEGAIAFLIPIFFALWARQSWRLICDLEEQYGPGEGDVL